MRLDGATQRFDARPTHTRELDELQTEMWRAGKEDREPERCELWKVAVLEQNDVQQVVAWIRRRHRNLRPRPALGVREHRRCDNDAVGVPGLELASHAELRIVEPRSV